MRNENFGTTDEHEVGDRRNGRSASGGAPVRPGPFAIGLGLRGPACLSADITLVPDLHSSR